MFWKIDKREILSRLVKWVMLASSSPLLFPLLFARKHPFWKGKGTHPYGFQGFSPFFTQAYHSLRMWRSLVPYPTLNQPTYGPKQTVPTKTTPKKFGEQNKTKPHSLPFVGGGLTYDIKKKQIFIVCFKPCTNRPTIGSHQIWLLLNL